MPDLCSKFSSPEFVLCINRKMAVHEISFVRDIFQTICVKLLYHLIFYVLTIVFLRPLCIGSKFLMYCMSKIH